MKARWLGRSFSPKGPAWGEAERGGVRKRGGQGVGGWCLRRSEAGCRKMEELSRFSPRVKASH